jgi:uncharacterized protein (UPF0548 family)
MGLITSATLSWFDDGCCDIKYLDKWQNAPLSFTPGQVTDTNWYSDSYEKVVLSQATDSLFQQAADLLLRFQFYPKQILSSTGDFDLDQRRLRRGDRIVQRIHVLRLMRRAILDVIAIAEITAVVNEPRRVGFSYATVFPHVVQGEWQIAAVWDKSGDLRLKVDSILRPDPTEPNRNHRLIRHFQRYAHQQGLNQFTRIIQKAARQSPSADRHILDAGE